MKISADAKLLLEACLVAATVAPSRPSKPALGRVLLTAEGDTLTVSATDLDTGLSQVAEGVEIGRPGRALLPPAKLVAILRESAGSVTIAADAEATAMKTSGGRFSLPAGDPHEFPGVDVFPAGPCTSVSVGDLRRLLNRVAWSADRHESMARFATKGVLFCPDRKRLRLVGTDTRKAAWSDCPATDTPADRKEYIVPIRAVGFLEKCLPKDDGASVRMSFGANVVAFAVGSTVLRSRLVEGRFPPYRDIIPKKPGVTLTIPTAEFLSCVRQAAIMTDDESKRVEFKFEPGKLTLNAQGGADHGSGEVTLPLPDYKGNEVEIAFNPQYLIEMIRAVDDAATITLDMVDGDKPAIFRAGDDFACLVMPIVG